MHIVSISRRTDIPAFYTPWLMNRLRAGFCHWIHPFAGTVHRVSLRPEDCTALVFWSRNPRPLIPHLRWLDSEGYAYYFHFTINGYPKEIETNNPPLASALDTFRRLSDHVSPARVIWRYDPILVSDVTPVDYHINRFDEIGGALHGFTLRCYTSFTSFYGKTSRNLRNVEQRCGIQFVDPPLEDRVALIHRLRDVAAARGITLYSCCDDRLVGDGIEKGHCIGQEMITVLRPGVDSGLKSAPTRKDCGCVKAVDIGVYDMCAFGCAYCYATNSRAAALDRMREHDPQDSVLWRLPVLRNRDLSA